MWTVASTLEPGAASTWMSATERPEFTNVLRSRWRCAPAQKPAPPSIETTMTMSRPRPSHRHTVQNVAQNVAMIVSLSTDTVGESRQARRFRTCRSCYRTMSSRSKRGGGWNIQPPGNPTAKTRPYSVVACVRRSSPSAETPPLTLTLTRPS